MPRKKGICKICGKETSTFLYERCRICYNDSRKKLSDEEKILYKHDWFQENKEYLKNKRRQKPISKEKTRQYNFKSTYGISLEEYNSLLELQNYSCIICGRKHKDDGKPEERLHVDHNHTTGKVRALICFKCNVALGHFNDDIILLKKAVKYMEEHD